ncbi:MAG: cation:proton antiporter subunit C [Desulfamplus sp.]|nr:cation:proton antiporter subunit C [Desulfamplus sp.]
MDIVSLIAAKANYWTYVILLMVGLYAMVAKNNLVKKIVGMVIFQTAVILFYVSIGYKKGGTLPIIMHGHDHGHGVESVIKAADYINPLPHVLMLTAIVVGVATLGVALALAIKVYQEYGTLEEDEIRKQIELKG